jgi:mono/diheme cytochrome c family protein
MNRFCIAAITVIGLLSIPVLNTLAGGWAVITLKDLPENFVVGKPAALTFWVRQHGVSLTDGLSPTIDLSRKAGPTLKVNAKATGLPGEYKAAVILPDAGEWTIRINSNLFGDLTLLPVNAVPVEGSAPLRSSPVARGEQLFVAKGCISCHVNKEVASKNLVDVGPELTGKRFPSDWLKSFLANPEKTSGKAPEYGSMPNLNLDKEEIDALAAFINRDRSVPAKLKAE